MEGEDIPDLRGFSLTFGLTEIVGALAVILISVWMGHYQGGFAWQSDPQKEFNWHPVLMSFSLIFLYGNAILIYRVLRTERKKKLKLTHALLHLLILILVIVGLKAVFDSHNLSVPPYTNMYTLHSWFGLTTVILFACQWLAGFTSFMFPGLRAPLRRWYLPIHTFFGLAIFLGAVAAALMGILEKAHWAITDYAKLPGEAVMVNCTGMLLVIFAGLVVYLVANPRFKRRPLPEDEMLLTDTIGE